MMAVFKYIFVILGLSSVAFSSDVLTAFLNSKLCPGALSKPPEKYLQVEFTGGAADLGNTLTVPHTGIAKPNITWDADPDTYYALFFIDPDTPYPGALEFPGQHLHWAVGNIKGNNITTGDNIATFTPPLPPPLSAPHRYTLVVYQQQAKHKFARVPLIKTLTFDIEKYVTTYKLGDPMYGNFFTAVFV